MGRESDGAGGEVLLEKKRRNSHGHKMIRNCLVTQHTGCLHLWGGGKFNLLFPDSISLLLLSQKP